MTPTTRVRPTGQERSFGTNELIVSKTDPRGHITYANGVFCRVSGYASRELIGAPHSIIRHPQMPRGVFRLLWDSITAGREIFAYVDNLAADGAHYWVLAHVTPSYDSDGQLIGYHSNRRHPERHAIEAVSALYDRVLAEEQRHGTAQDAAAAGAAYLIDHLAEANTTYDQFVWGVIHDETALRVA